MTAPDADERRIRNLLVHMGVGPDAVPLTAPAADPELAAVGEASDSWWDELYGDEELAAPEPERRPAPRLPDWWGEKPEDLSEQPEQDTEQVPNTPANTAPTSPNSIPEPDPTAVKQPQERHNRQQSLLDAWDSVRPRTRWLIYHGTAAGLGWGLGLTTWSTQVTAWIAADRYANPQAIACYALAACAVTAYRRTRGWWWPIAWMASAPIASIVLGVLLYAPNS